MKKGLTANQLKVIAIIAMVIDHTAWGFVDMFTPLGQIMHVIGRLTIPIMTFFIAEGYRRTSSVKGYIERMATFAVITIIPFYLFFGEEYGYRQNIIFDLLLALGCLSALEAKYLPKVVRISIFTGLMIVSALVGGWVITPILFTLTYYYGKSFKQKCFFISLITTLTVGTSVVLILLNDAFNLFPQYSGWVWYQWFYFFGFVLALPLLKLYNGEKGEYPFKKRHFFFTFYPAHFLVLYIIKLFLNGEYQRFYVCLNLVALLVTVMFSFKLFSCKPSKAVTSAMALALAGAVYIAGFIIEVNFNNPDIAYAGVIVQYLGEVLVYFGFVLFMGEFCGIKVPKYIEAIVALIGVYILWMVCTARENHLFYTDFYMVYDGLFPRMEYEYGIGFYIFVVYSMLVCLAVVFASIRLLVHGDKLTKKRAQYMLWGVCCPWLAYVVKLTGITGGIEVSCLGVFGSIYFVQTAVWKFGFFDSVQLAAENAIYSHGDGVLITDGNYKILYINKSMSEIMPTVKEGEKANLRPVLASVITGAEDRLKVGDRLFRVDRTVIEQQGYTTGYMISIKDVTEHLLAMESIERVAHTDYLTGLYNRRYFTELYVEHRKNGGVGTLIMIDLDNFKAVNDTLGHENGDKLLVIAGEIIKSVAGTYNFACRMGGDEYMLFVKDMISRDGVAGICEGILKNFNKRVADADFGVKTTMSIGATIEYKPNTEVDAEEFKTLFRRADDAMYSAKKAGKATYYIE